MYIAVRRGLGELLLFVIGVWMKLLHFRNSDLGVLGTWKTVAQCAKLFKNINKVRIPRKWEE